MHTELIWCLLSKNFTLHHLCTEWKMSEWQKSRPRQQTKNSQRFSKMYMHFIYLMVWCVNVCACDWIQHFKRGILCIAYRGKCWWINILWTWTVFISFPFMSNANKRAHFSEPHHAHTAHTTYTMSSIGNVNLILIKNRCEFIESKWNDWMSPTKHKTA